jgi:hypothetical protein
MRNTKLAQPSHEPAGTVEQIELVFLATVERLARTAANRASAQKCDLAPGTPSDPPG